MWHQSMQIKWIAPSRETRRGAQSIGEERTELRLAHLARGHGEFAMSSSGNCMATDSNGVGRIKERRIDACPAADDPLQEFGVSAVATSYPAPRG